MIKRILSITLCAIIMCTGLLGVTASATPVNTNIAAPIITGLLGRSDGVLATNKI